TVGSLDWNLTACEGLLVSVAVADGKVYTLNLKDIMPAGDRKTTLLYETNSTDVFLPWANFTSTYEGRTQPDAKPLNISSIKTMSLMMRSYFGKQEGEFTLTVKSIAAAACKTQ
ncbi:NADH:ubiquinone oxidoreductase complex I intermediate-associated protein 30, partial [Apiospora arundinis]